MSKMRGHGTIKRLLTEMNYQYREDNLTDPEPGVIIPEDQTLFDWSKGGLITPYFTTSETGTATTSSTGTKFVPATSGTYSTSVSWTLSDEEKDTLKRVISTGLYKARMRRKEND